ncbi:HEAT repeat domain-containing protein [Longimicrobium sp.]|jgi:HEAT repeat protein|uniref:HEAT repeat domain-containing protein n=1 Tax=Longimicrobium sp. TaxID=2029185 RepID=UPI002ED9D680
MSLPSAAHLAFWNDPDELLQALYRLGREPVPELREALRQLLDHADPDIREEAIRVLATRWKDESARLRAFDMLRNDPTPMVRSAAAFAIGGTSTSASRNRDTRLLLSVLRDVAQPMDVRRAAYDALIIAHRKGAGEKSWPFPSHRSEFDPVRSVDWEWLRSLEEAG